MNPADRVKEIVHYVFEKTSVCRDKREAYNEGLAEVFRLQGERVIYPNQQTTCFKYRNKTYFNPEYPKVFENKIEINLRHLHPTLMAKMDNLHKEIDDWDQNKRRLQAYLMRSLNVYHNVVNRHLDIQTHIVDHSHVEPFQFFVFHILPSCIKSIIPNYSAAIGISGVKSIPFQHFKDDVISKAEEFIEKESATVEHFKLFVFKTSVLGF